MEVPGPSPRGHGTTSSWIRSNGSGIYIGYMMSCLRLFFVKMVKLKPSIVGPCPTAVMPLFVAHQCFCLRLRSFACRPHQDLSKPSISSAGMDFLAYKGC